VQTNPPKSQLKTHSLLKLRGQNTTRNWQVRTAGSPTLKDETKEVAKAEF